MYSFTGGGSFLKAYLCNQPVQANESNLAPNTTLLMLLMTPLIQLCSLLSNIYPSVKATLSLSYYWSVGLRDVSVLYRFLPYVYSLAVHT